MHTFSHANTARIKKISTFKFYSYYLVASVVEQITTVRIFPSVEQFKTEKYF